jgi:hypothetical protein
MFYPADEANEKLLQSTSAASAMNLKVGPARIDVRPIAVTEKCRLGAAQPKT